MTGLTAEVALEGAVFAFDKLYTYIIPPELHRKAAVGCRVVVPFGRGNAKRQGIIFSVKTAELSHLKNIFTVTDTEPVISAEMVKICEYMRDNYFCTYYDAVNAMLPAGLKYRLLNFYSVNGDLSGDISDSDEKAVLGYLVKHGERDEEQIVSALGIEPELLNKMCAAGLIIKSRNTKRLMRDASEKWVCAVTDVDGIALTPRQKQVAEFVINAGEISAKELMYYTGVSQSVIEKLVEKQVLKVFSKRVFRTESETDETDNRNIELTDEQQRAYDGLLDEYGKSEGAVSLLYGVTGSGKTQIFLKLADRVLEDNRGVIIMVPEIALTPQMLRIFKSRYGDKIAVFHSAMSLGKRMDEWQRIKSGRASIALGTRSAVFAPFSNLGLIIMDEEHEHTYKSEQSPRFHARDIAKIRTAYHGGLLCLASATPSLESYTAAKLGKYMLLRLEHRFGNAVLPEVETVDMKKEILDGNAGSISRRLYDGISATLENKKQVILLLNRRGHNTYVSCPDCGEVLSCPNCSISLTYHSANRRLMCHYCGYSVPASGKCPSCGGEHLKFMGTGTQKVEEELNNLFPGVRVLRIDADSTVSRDSYSEGLERFSNGEYDILLGTQMVAKGLDFPNVTLVGVLGADSAAFSDDFRSFERTFSLLTQVVGRAGRGENAGRAIIQSLNPEGWLISLAAKQDYDGFYNEEILTRKLMVYPPYCDICVVCTRSAFKETAEKAAKTIFDNIKAMLNGEYCDIKAIILGPAPASVPKVNNRYRCRMIIKCKNTRRFREMLRRAIDVKLVGDTAVAVDMNPETII